MKAVAKGGCTCLGKSCKQDKVQRKESNQIAAPHARIDVQHVLDTGLHRSSLDVVRPTDPTEIDADREAKQVLSEPPRPSPYSYCRTHLPDTALAWRALPGGRVTDPFIRSLGSGRPLDASMRAFFEPRFNHDFDAVRLHTGSAAQQATAAVGAEAFTVGLDIALGDSIRDLGSADGRRLLAHELAHVVQQDNHVPAIRRVGAEDPPFGYFAGEREILRREAEERRAQEERHREWIKSHQAGHKEFLGGSRTTTLSEDIVTAQQQLVEQRMALLSEASKRTDSDQASKQAAPNPFGSLHAPALPSGVFGGMKVVIPTDLASIWANAEQQTVVVKALLDGKQFTPEDAAPARAAFIAFYQALIPVADVVDHNAAEQERMSRSLSDSWTKQHGKPCPNCHTPQPGSMPLYHAPPPSTPYLEKSLDLTAAASSASEWKQVLDRFASATRTMDAIVLTTVPADHPSAEGFVFARGLLGRQQDLQASDPEAIRIPAVFYPEDKWVKVPDAEGKEVEIASGIPWYFYLTHTPMPSPTQYPEGFTWTLRDVTSPKRPEVSYEPSGIERGTRGNLYATDVPEALFEELNNKLVFPKGMLYWRYPTPDGREGSLRTTEPWSLSDWLGNIGLGIAGLALILSTAGLATPEVLLGLGIGSAAFSAGSTLADLREKSELGILTEEDKNKAILFIAADIASALSAGLGHAASELGRAAAAAGRVSKLAIVVRRTATVAGAIDKAFGKAVLVTMTADFVSQYETITNSNLTQEEREKALHELTASAIFTGAIVLAPHAVGAFGPKLSGRTPHGSRDPLGLRTGEEPKPVATITRGEPEPRSGWSKPRADTEFSTWSTKQETLPPEQAAHELQVAEASGTRRDLPNDKRFKQEIEIENHRWREERGDTGVWCRFSRGHCYTKGQLNVGVRGKGERVTATTKQDLQRLRAELATPPSGLRTDQARLDWADYRFYAERRLRLIEEALAKGTTPPPSPKTFRSFQDAYPPGSVVRNEIQSELEKITRSKLKGPATRGADTRTASRGGIKSIRGKIVGNRQEIVIEGMILDPIDRSVSPNFNREGIWAKIRAEHPELADYQAAHLWGPGFGDEAAAGIMLAPPEFNLEWQNSGIEGRIREWHKIVKANGGQLEVRAVAVSHDRTIGGGVLLSHVEYTISVRTPQGQVHEIHRIGLSVDAPPSRRVTVNVH